MRPAITTLLLALSFLLSAQDSATPFTESGFESQVLDYAPPHREGVDDKAYEFGTMVLRETVRQTNDDTGNFTVSDYFNVLTGFLSLQESEEAINLAFERFLRAPGACEYLRYFYEEHIKNKEKYAPIILRWEVEMARCVETGEGIMENLDAEQYAKENGFDLPLVLLLDEVAERDRRHRKKKYDADKQMPLDRENERIIDSLYLAHGDYVGRSLVGEKMMHVMWLVVQHSRAETMERYLPIIAAAVKKDELNETPLRMLIDRVYVNRTGKQVFGSQGGVGLLPEKKRKEIEQAFEIE